MKLVRQSSLTQSIIRHILDFPSYLYWDTAYLAKKKKRLLSDLLFSGYDEQLASGYSLVI